MAYDKQTWTETTPVSPGRLQHIEDGLGDVEATYAPIGSVGGLDPEALAEELANPETAANSAVVTIVSAAVPAAVINGVDFTADIATPRPAWPGSLVWKTTDPDDVPVHIANGDVIRRLTETVIEWTPAQLPNLFAWYSARQISGVAADAPLAQWNDLSGNGHHAKQATVANQPLYRTAGLNGHPCVEFDGTNDILLTDAFAASLGEAFTVYAVAQSTPVTTTGSDYFFDGMSSTNVATRLGAYRTATNTLVISRGTAIANPPTLDNSINRFRFVFNGASSSIRIGAGTPVTGTTALSGSEIVKLAVGGRSDANASNLLVGKITELIFVKGSVSTDDDGKTATFLQQLGVA